MENNPIKTMLHEHDVICSTAQIIEKINNLWVEDPERYTSVVNSLIIFFREYADEYHHRKEEEVLFPAINAHPDFTLIGLLDEFEQHHESFREYTADILEALQAENFEKSYKELERYLQDLLDHIGAENDELFVMVETFLSDDELETIFFKLKDIDMELGEDRKIELEKSIEQLL